MRVEGRSQMEGLPAPKLVALVRNLSEAMHRSELCIVMSHYIVTMKP